MPVTHEALQVSMLRSGEYIEIIWNRELHKKVKFDFALEDALFERDGPDLVVRVKSDEEEESSVRLLNFFSDHPKDELPTFIFSDDQVLPSQ